ncbi:type IV secretory pathway TraG/TraD family ATPase VirD4 [Rivihabitans pingtungensis]|uniref:Type IV secretory pathway TraG/TraD family ATPase VirD4 n=2 Tax=Rivihabitans pingtungensis TaxID=1054498 RepID=A0A318KIB7_9NEIS|nr:type IV secretory pathway TraG/TraD family ATPase VirD4 [Rivihabitans pingtungensis]
MLFIAPLLFVLLVNLTLGAFSKTLASLVTLIIIAGPVLWHLNELRKVGRDALLPENWTWALRHVLIVVPAVLAVYWMRNDHQLWGLGALLFYGALATNAWLAIFASLKLSGANGGDESVRRGSVLVDAAEMNARTSRKAHDDGDVTIGGVTIPRMLEAQHFLISGTTGAGKTQVINGMLRSIRTRRNRAVIADPAGGFYARFGQAGDLLFNPFDGRTVDWSPFAEIRADYDCERIAKAIIPDVDGGEGAQWQLFAQTLLAKAMLAMHRNGERSMKRLMYWMASADQKQLEPLLAGTAAAVMCQRGNDKMLNNTRATMLPYLSVFEYLPDEGRFSIRQFIQDESRDNWLFITYRDDQMGMLRNIVATALEMAIVEGLSLSENQNRGLWYVMDEVDSLGKVTSLRAGLTKLRKYGGRCVLGLQTVAQLRTTYGRDEAQTLIANTSVKCILRAGDSETAKSMENELGEQEIERVQVSDSFTTTDDGQSESQNTSIQVVRQSTVLASEIMGLPDLQGFLKLPGDEIARISVDYVSMPDQNPAFQ